MIRRIVPLEDAVAPRRSRVVGPAAGVRNAALAALLGERELGGWSLSPAAVDLLEQAILEHRPELILEFGSGVSTACLAHFQRELAGIVGRPLVVSLEEDKDQARTTSALLDELGLAGTAAVLAAPLADRAVEGGIERCYEPPIGALTQLFGGRRAGLVLVDGPSLPSGGSRFATVPLARDLIASGAVVFLDDARRDSELAVARRWKRLPWLDVRAIHLVGKGVLEARVRRLREEDPLTEASA